MDVLAQRCAGIDIGKNEVVACVRTPAPSGRGRRKQTRTFPSFTGELEAMADWFTAEGVTEVAMAATGLGFPRNRGGSLCRFSVEGGGLVVDR
jgi:transposase